MKKIRNAFEAKEKFRNSDFIQSVFSLHNEIDVPRISGLYMLAEKIMPFNFTEEIIYLIKIGQAKNLYRRINEYKGMNPGAQCISFMPVHQAFLSDAEKDWLAFFQHKHVLINGTKEWFMVSKEDYEQYCKLGFKA